MIEIDNENRQLIYSNTVEAEDGTMLNVRFVMNPTDIQTIHEWKQGECDKADIDDNISEYLNTEELRRFNNMDEARQLEFIIQAAARKRHYMDSNDIAWREATELAIKDMRDKFLQLYVAFVFPLW